MKNIIDRKFGERTGRKKEGLKQTFPNSLCTSINSSSNKIVIYLSIEFLFLLYPYK